MRIINVLLFVSMMYGQVFQGSLGLIGQFPKGEFKEQGVPTGFGINGSGIVYTNPNIGLGLNINLNKVKLSSVLKHHKFNSTTIFVSLILHCQTSCNTSIINTSIH